MAYLTSEDCKSCPTGKKRKLELIAYEGKAGGKEYARVCFRCDSLHEWPRLGRK